MHKRAVIIGINYLGTTDRLKSCVNDAKAMVNFCQQNGYEVRSYIEGESLAPTYHNLLQSFEWLTNNVGIPVELSHCLFFYSGHGKSLLGGKNESDGRDESIIPIDYKSKGIISDNVLRSKLIDRLPPHAIFHGIFDCCNGGTICDLMYSYSWRNNQITTLTQPGLITPGFCCTISASHDDQVAYDSTTLSVFTEAFLRYWASVTNYEELMARLHSHLKAKQQPVLSFGSFTSLKTKIDF